MSKQKIDWEQIAEDHNMSYNEFAEELFEACSIMLSIQMDERGVNAIAVPVKEFELILQRAKLKQEYNH